MTLAPDKSVVFKLFTQLKALPLSINFHKATVAVVPPTKIDFLVTVVAVTGPVAIAVPDVFVSISNPRMVDKSSGSKIRKENFLLSSAPATLLATRISPVG